MKLAPTIFGSGQTLTSLLNLRRYAPRQVIGCAFSNQGDMNWDPTMQLESTDHLLWLRADQGLTTGGARQFYSADKTSMRHADNAFFSTGDIDFLWAGWVYLDSLSGDNYIFAKGGPGEYQLRTSGTQIEFLVYCSPSSPTAVITGLSASKWYFFLAWHDSVANTVNLSINNGTASSVSTGGISPVDSADEFVIGGRGVYPAYMTGRISRPSFLKNTAARAVIDSAATQTAMYNLGRGILSGNLDLLLADLGTFTAGVDWDAWNLNETDGTASARSFSGLNDLTPTFGELITNGGFETAGAGGADVFGSWNESALGTSAISRDTVAFDAGAASCKFTMDASGSQCVLDQTLGTVGHRYTSSVRAIVDSTSGTPTFEVLHGGHIQILTPTTSWATYATTATATAFSGVYIRSSGSPVVNNADRVFNFDTFSYKAVDIPSVDGPNSDISPDTAGCFHPSSLVLTSEGMQTAESLFLKQSGRLYGTSGLQDIEHFFSRDYTGEMFSITANGATATLTPNHRVLVVAGPDVRTWKNTNRQNRYLGRPSDKCDLSPQWVRAEHVKEGDYVVFPRNDVEESSSIEWISKEIGVTITDRFFDFLGWYIAEGHCDGNRVGLCFGPNDPVDDIKLMIEELFGCNVSSWKEDNARKLRFGHKMLSQFLVSQFGKGAVNKRIPEWLVNESEQVISRVLRTYAKGDGHLRKATVRSKPRLCLTTGSAMLAGGLVLLLSRLGASPSISSKVVDGGHRISGRLVKTTIRHEVVVRQSELHLLGLQEQSHWSQSVLASKFVLCPVRNVAKSLYSGPVYDFTTPSHTIGVPWIVHNSNHGQLIGFADSETARSTDTADGSPNPTVLDQSGNGYHGLMVGFAAPDTARSAHGLTGVPGQKVTMTGAEYILGTTASCASADWSVCAFIKCTTANKYWFSMGSVAGANTNVHFGVQNDTTVILNQFADGWTPTSPVSLLNQTRHIAFTYTHSTKTGRLYIDGAFVDSHVYGASYSGNTTTFVGGLAHGTPINSWVGDIFDLRMFSSAISLSDIAAIAAGDSGLTGSPVLRYDFDEADTRTLTTIGAGTSLSFDGVDDYVACGNAATLQLSTGTVSAWINTSDAGTGYCAIAVKQSAYSLFLNSNVLSIYDWGAVAGRSTGVSLNDSDWHHVAVTFQSGIVNGTEIYIDGVSVLTTTMTIANQLSGLEIGNGGAGSGQEFAGKIDDVRIYSTALSAAQVLQLSQGTEATGATPVAHWTFDEETSLSVTDGDPIAIARSLEGNRYQLLNATASERPEVVKVGLNGKQGLRFDSIDDMLVYTGTILSGTSGSTFLIYTLEEVPNAYQTLLAQSDTATATKYVAFHARGNTANPHIGYAQRNADTEDLLDGSTEVTDNLDCAVYWDCDGTTHRAWLNGTAQTLNADTGANNGDLYDDTTGEDVVSIGGLKHTSETNHAGVVLYEIYNHPLKLTDASRAKIAAYVLRNYGLTL